ncbi:Na(+)/H(+) exchange regulatory cofactor NHE-RF1 [Merluccius polli]|uniref:Na(+)/H(+) exchange regulatory cofactor NHE-RF1 n=1 Tax=Merluccius polli TaxID=89951 RepID=A0AA47NNK5_MERPO|nr:Na(+)/H(+) exchange regulatory cofactor NHE-RF1 [Merluccius polli]
MPSKSEYLRPRLCVLEKGDNGYGFHLHGEKGKTGQFIRLVEPDSPSETSGLRAGDRLVFVNGDNVERESHQQVVSRIRATAGKLDLVVVDVETDQLLRKHGIKCLGEYVADGLPLPLDDDDDVDVDDDVEVGEGGEEEEEVEEMDEAVEEITEEEEQQRRVGENGTPVPDSPVPDSPVPETNGGTHGHVEKKLSANSDHHMEFSSYILSSIPVSRPCGPGPGVALVMRLLKGGARD